MFLMVHRTKAWTRYQWWCEWARSVWIVCGGERLHIYTPWKWKEIRFGSSNFAQRVYQVKICLQSKLWTQERSSADSTDCRAARAISCYWLSFTCVWRKLIIRRNSSCYSNNRHSTGIRQPSHHGHDLLVLELGMEAFMHI